MGFAFQLISTDGEILETFETNEQRWATGDTVIAHGNRRERPALLDYRTAMA